MKKDLFIKLYKPIITLAQEIPEKGNIILMGNHPNKLDSILVSTLSNNIHFLMQDSKWIYRDLPTIRGEIKDKGLMDLIDAFIALENGKVLCLFPENEVNKSNELIHFNKDIMKLAIKSNSSIIPFGIKGNYSITNKNLEIETGPSFLTNGMNELQLECYLKEEINKIIKK